MILGIGQDLVEIARVENLLKKHPRRFLDRCFTDIEIEAGENHKSLDEKIRHYAVRFAAKEAFVKALGTGFQDGVIMKDIGVASENNGKPFLLPHNAALEKLHELTPEGMRPAIHLSLSHEKAYAQAFIIIEALML